MLEQPDQFSHNLFKYKMSILKSDEYKFKLKSVFDLKIITFIKQKRDK